MRNILKSLIVITAISTLSTAIWYTYEINDFLQMLVNWVDLNTLINESNKWRSTSTIYSSNTNINTTEFDDEYEEEDYDIDAILSKLHENISNPDKYYDDNPWDILDNWFSREFNDAYNFAHEYWITTQNSIYSANMEWWLTRIAMSKMLSEYAINVLWYDYDWNQNCYFWDVSYDMNNAYNDWVCKAFSLWIMGQNMKNNLFRPFDSVTRAEFATALSRLLYNTPDWSDYYYTTHIQKLYDKWIISNTNPYLTEVRWYIMLMLMRATNN